MEKKKPVARMLALWGAAIAVLGVISFETGGAPIRALRSPVGLIAVASAVGYSVYRGSKRANLDSAPEAQTSGDGLPAVNRILRLAREHKGRLTVGEVLAETSLSPEDVRKVLDDLTFSGTCQLVIGEKGMQIYYFPEFEDASLKESDALAAKMPQGQTNKQ